jgi:hypothetical protein
VEATRFASGDRLDHGNRMMTLEEGFDDLDAPSRLYCSRMRSLPRYLHLAQRQTLDRIPFFRGVPGIERVSFLISGKIAPGRRLEA